MGTGSGKANAHQDQGGGFEALEPGPSQSITFSGVSTQSTAFSSKTSIIRIFCTQDCFLSFGPNPTATTSGYFLPAGIIDFVGVNQGPFVAVIQSTQAGTLYVTEGL